MNKKNYKLKYGSNPHQKEAQLSTSGNHFPFEILNGNPGYINFMDAFNSWQLVKELSLATNLPAATSFKHVSPAGVGVGLPLTEELRKIYFISDYNLSPLACAYARARGTDRVSSFGDWVALSETVDVHTAKLIQSSISDGVIAPGYSDEALMILQKKKKGNYNIIKIDSKYEAESIEQRDIFGVTFSQTRNNSTIAKDNFSKVVTVENKISTEVELDMVISLITLKYTQSNSVCFTFNGQTIGIGAGQQSRIHCTRSAASKADNWFLRQHPKVLSLEFIDSISTTDRDNAIDYFLLDEDFDNYYSTWSKLFITAPTRLTKTERKSWISRFNGITFASDGFIPFRDNIDRAYKSGARYIIQPGGSKRDFDVIKTCNDYRISMVFSGIRLFHH